MKQNYARAFRIIRAAFGLRQAQLAAKIPITPSQLSLIEAGKRQPSLRVVNSLAAAVGIPAALVSLLASNISEIEAQNDVNISELGGVMLRLLMSADDSPQQDLELSKP